MVRMARTGMYHGGNNSVEKLHDGDLSAQPRPDRAHFQSNIAAANDDHLLGDLLEGQGASGAHDAAQASRILPNPRLPDERV